MTTADVLKKDLLRFAEQLYIEVAKEKAGAQIKLRPVLLKDIEDYSAGSYLRFADLMKGGGSFYIYLDRWAGLPQPRYWLGFKTSALPRLEEISASAQSYSGQKPLEFGQEDCIEEPISRLRHPLRQAQFDRLVVERHPGWGDFFCGIYSPYPIPLSGKHRNALAFEANAFLLGSARDLLTKYKSKGSGPHDAQQAQATKTKADRAAIRTVKARLQTGGYEIVNRQRSICGYDLLARRPENRDEIHVEVKGTVGAVQHFFISETEHKAALDSRWRLAIVTSVLSKPKFDMMTGSAMKSRFQLRAIKWKGLPKK